MESLTKELANLSLQKKTGITYHRDMLKHTPCYDEKKVDEIKAVFENPFRLSAILERLEKSGLLDDCVVEKNVEEIDWKHVLEVHDSKYVEYFKNLWKDEYTKPQTDHIDTYFCKDTLRAARLAAEATRLAAEKVQTGEWENAFALVRPPGHHANAKDQIGGFCFLNNVLIAARDLQKNHGVKKILILDWDVHHGDSTQKLCYEDKGILYMSVHLFYNGIFYPGESGDVNNLGKGEGLGYNLNFPLNPIDYQYLGDPSYIYMFERVLFPVIKEYAPDFILISCGFDCLYEDPIGALNVTRDALSFMLFKLKNLIQSKVVVALEGGYNLDQISSASECLLRVLMGEFYPNKVNHIQFDIKNIVKHANPTKLFVKNTKENIEVWKKYWPVLESQELLDFQERVDNKIENEEILMGGHTEGMYQSQDFILKVASADEVRFFAEKYPLLACINHLFPKIYGIKNKNGVEMLKFENILDNNNFNILNIRLCDRYKPEKGNKEFIDKFRFFITSYVIKNTKKVVVEKKHLTFNRLNETKIDGTMARFFKINKKSEKDKIKKKIISFIDELLNVVVKNKLNISQAGICLLYDPETQKIKCKLLEIHKIDYDLTTNTIIAIKGVRDYFSKFLTNVKVGDY